VWQRYRELSRARGSKRASLGDARVLARVEKRRIGNPCYTYFQGKISSEQIWVKNLNFP
jgi:hypothetical protein